jgi:hypothetical protein
VRYTELWQLQKGVIDVLEEKPGGKSAQAAIMKHLRLVNLYNRNVLIVALEAGKSKIKVPADLVSAEGLFLIDGILCVSSHAEEQKATCS